METPDELDFRPFNGYPYPILSDPDAVKTPCVAEPFYAAYPFQTRRRFRLLYGLLDLFQNPSVLRNTVFTHCLQET